jgi:subtilisin family serine protease
MSGKNRRQGLDSQQDHTDSPPDANTPRDKPFLVARQDALLPLGVEPLDHDALLDMLAADPTVTVERVIAPEGLALLSDTPTSLQRVVVARMADEKAEELNQHPQILIEEDALLRPVPAPVPVVVDLNDPGSFLPFGGSTTWGIRVTGPEDTPVVGATVYLYGGGVPAQGRTDKDGIVSLSLLNESDDTIRALYINPQSTYWNLWINNPRLRSADTNTMRLAPLSTTLPGFPDTQTLGWGQRTMRLDQLDSSVTGAGVTVAVVDSGAAISHSDLGQVKTGKDFTATPANDTGWTNDVIAHGSHCSGVIAGRNDAAGIRGFAPDVELRELRIFPGGRFSSLLDALDYCIDRQIDVVNMSLGSPATSDIMRQKLEQAKQAGVACIVAAGNTGGAVQFPGSSPDVLTVAAIGKIGEFPPSSFHAQQIPADRPQAHGYFAAKFSCHGPEVDVCAPGVAIVSSVPANGYAAWDGTSMATPHVTGLAALVLAHHPDFANGFKARNAARVDRLFQILKSSATPLNFGDPGLTGAGVPDAVRAITSQPSTTGSTSGGATPAASIIVTLLDQLRAEYAAAGLLKT